jgi:HEAT repeat protein
VHPRNLLWIALPLCLGFEWPGRLARLQHEATRGKLEQRVEAASALSRYDAASVRDTLLRALEDDATPVRLSASETATQLRIVEARPIWLDWLDDPEPGLRAAALRGLSAIGDASDLATLTAALADPSPDIRGAALDGVLASADLDVLMARVADPDPYLRTAAIAALGRTRDPRALPALLARCQDTDASVAREAVLALGALNDPGAIDALAARLVDDSAQARDALYALARIDDPRALAALEAARTKPALALDLDAALAARTKRTGALATLPPREETSSEDAPRTELSLEAQARLQALEQAIRGDDDAASAHALEALRAWAPPAGSRVVAEQLASRSPHRRLAAALALSAFDDEETRRLLRYVLIHASDELTVAAATALGEVGDHRDAGALVKLTERKRWPVPAAASFALARLAQRGEIKKHAMSRTLCGIATSKDPFVRRNIQAALAALAADGCNGEPIAPLRIDQREAASVTAHASDAQTPLRHRLVGLRMADGAVMFGYTDVNARMFLRSVPAGPLVLEDPAAIVIE